MKLFGRFVGSLIVVWSTASPAVEPFAVYDNFNSKFISPEKWTGGGVGSDVREFLRLIQAKVATPNNGYLRLLGRNYGSGDSNIGGFGNSIALDFAQPSTVTAIRADVTVNTSATSSCTGNPAKASASAHISGYFFNTGIPTPGSHLNDVYATIRIARQTNGKYRAETYVARCNDAFCAGQTSLGFAALGLVTKGIPTKLQIQWDPDNNRFIFKQDAKIQVRNYLVADTGLVGSQGKRIEVQLFSPNCATATLPSAAMDVVFDNVAVNASAVQ